MAALIARVFGWQGEAHTNPFPDRCDATGNCVDDELWRAVAAPCYLPRDNVSRVQVVSIVARAFTATDGRATGFWARQPAVSGQYANVPDEGTQRGDLATYRANAGAIPGQADDGTFPTPGEAATRRFIIQVLWQTYSSVYGVDTVP